jgi:hypothetical protein
MNDKKLIEVYAAILRDRGASVDDILVEPPLRILFVTECQHLLGDYSEPQFLRRLITLRKRKRLPRRDEVNSN